MVTEFQKKVYNVVRKIPRGKTMSYKEVAEKINSSPRAVGQALKKNPYAPKVPCHRVIKADGTIGGFNGKVSGKEVKRKIRMLRDEGVKLKEAGLAD